MKSTPDLHVFVSRQFLFAATGNCKDNNRELITIYNEEVQVEVCIFITV